MLMTKLSKIALLGTLALAAFTACQKNPELGVENEVEEVNAQFVFNVATAQTETKQSADAVQATTAQTFRGLNNALLLTYAQASNGQILYQDATANKSYDLAALVSAGGVNATETRRVLEMSLPIGTNTMLLYGKAPAGTSSVSGISNEDYFGHMDTWSVSSTVNSANFVAGRRLATTDEAKYHLVEKVLAGILTCGLNTFIAAGEEIVATDSPVSVESGGKPYKFGVNPTKAVSWEDYMTTGANSPVETGHTKYPLEDKLAALYKAMTTINTGEIRSGSGSAMLETIEDMWTVINEIRTADPVSEAEAYAKFLAQRVHLKLLNICEATVPITGMPVTGVSFKAPSSFAAAFTGTTAQWPVADGNPARPSSDDVSGLGTYNLGQFPMNFNLPRGASHYTFDSSTKLFSYVQNFDTSAMGTVTGGDAFGVHSYFYPSELMYFGNSPIRTSDTEHKTNAYPGTAEKAWEAAASWTTGGWADNSVVTSATRSIAMKYNVNYGSSLLKTRVKYAAGTLYDNNHKIQQMLHPNDGIPDAPAGNPNDQSIKEPNKAISVNATSFKLTGIIVGGQPHKVGWDYLPVKEGTSGSEKYVSGFVYDRYIPDGTIPAYNASPVSDNEKSQPVFTCVLDNYNADGAQQTVYVALEFQNNAGDFYGLGNMVPNQGYFYLIGALDLTGKAIASWPSNYQIPPYYTSGDNIGKSQKVTRVFVQDFMTSVTFALGENSLKSAYLTVPDLRASSLTVGVSVDMNWSTGIDFGEVVLGN